ncbi:MAG TPA: Wzz/FepE/Etk N-terminal domain-containing protein [Candidatus Rifleibacterium sp.]|nr:Wzz/FepE/Etk N-terminal domain-containing protein [Candidatus Rifleibacterium sp.]HPT47071.1 Wzz/FepE/Etk N-terminal domain-containing protein [Candidatus Rifleibacterium sp.]
MTEKFNDINPEQLKKEVKEELLKREILMGLEEDEIDLFELFRVLVKHWKLVVVMPVIVALVVAVYSLMLPNHFKASATIFVHSNSKLSALSSLPFAGMIPGLGGGGGGAEYLMVYLKSRTMSDRIIARFGIATNPAIVGDNPPEPDKIKYDNVLKTINQIVSVDKDKDGLITISAETMSASTSAEIAGAYIDYLSSFARGPQKEKRVFIEQQLAIVSRELAVAENEFKDFQDKHKMFAIERQSETIIESLAKLEAEKVGAGVSLQMQESLLKSSGSMPELVKVEAQKVAEQAKIEALQKEIVLVEKSLAALPDLALDFARLMRNLKVKEKVFGVLTEQYEMAKIAEAEEGSQFEVIDQPRAPEVKSKPRRSIMVILAGLSAGVLGVFAAFLIEFVRRRKEQEKQQAESGKTA